MNRKRRNKRRKLRFFALLCCVLCFLCGFTFRGTMRTTHADSGTKAFASETLEIPSLPLESESKYYTSIVVETGDSLYSIAQQFYSREFDNIEDYIKEIKEVNGLGSDYICQGSYLTIPYYGEL